MWAGPGGWTSGPAKAFSVTGVPTPYVITPQGKVAWAGALRPMESRTALVDSILRETVKFGEALRTP